MRLKPRESDSLSAASGGEGREEVASIENSHRRFDRNEEWECDKNFGTTIRAASFYAAPFATPNRFLSASARYLKIFSISGRTSHRWVKESNGAA